MHGVVLVGDGGGRGGRSRDGGGGRYSLSCPLCSPLKYCLAVSFQFPSPSSAVSNLFLSFISLYLLYSSSSSSFISKPLLPPSLPFPNTSASSPTYGLYSVAAGFGQGPWPDSYSSFFP